MSGRLLPQCTALFSKTNSGLPPPQVAIVPMCLGSEVRHVRVIACVWPICKANLGLLLHAVGRDILNVSLVASSPQAPNARAAGQDKLQPATHCSALNDGASIKDVTQASITGHASRGCGSMGRGTCAEITEFTSCMVCSDKQALTYCLAAPFKDNL